MSPRGRRASLPPADHVRPEPLSSNGLVVHHYNREQRVKEYDFTTLPVAEPMQRSLAMLFAAQCTPHRWRSHGSSKMYWRQLTLFSSFLAKQDQPPGDLDELTGALVNRWWQSLSKTAGGCNTFDYTARLLRGDDRLQSGPVADALARRVPRPKSQTQSYAEAEFDQIRTAARRMFRAALLRIDENARHLDRWHRGDFPRTSQDWMVGEALEHIARTADVPRYVRGGDKKREPLAYYRRILGGGRAENTWQRLFLSRMEATALGILLLAEYGWNLSTIDRANVPQALPDQGEDGHPTYRIPVEKRRRGAGNYFETRNVTDDGADSRGRLVTQALQATRFARAAVEKLAPGTDLLVVWRSNRPDRDRENRDRHPSIDVFSFGLSHDDAQEWAQQLGFTGSPFQRGRRTVVAVDRREPTQHNQDTHDRSYALVDKRVQADAIEVIASGAEDAAARARTAVLLAQLTDAPDPEHTETATADCSDFDHGPYPAPDGGCGASFLMCLGCENASVHPGHHPRLTHLHHALGNLRSVLPTRTWAKDWGDAHAQLDDLKVKLGDGTWEQGLARVTDADRDLIDLLLNGSLDT
ncbi:hypothetical protein [Streptomyces sp. NBC_01304]|uniref:hypothetical protein n=1 Tax=Streptomyces sp. NBC_01304 TaxID=2903818 RepID=UPI002E0E2573|nr:hypothetical protein OG430_15830 [Streptomyces sp. NBC_01304]WSJ89675.1 hypothetical protein OG430_40890 [Streptomyces sp. NBC_01304]